MERIGRHWKTDLVPFQQHLGSVRFCVFDGDGKGLCGRRTAESTRNVVSHHRLWTVRLKKRRGVGEDPSLYPVV